MLLAICVIALSAVPLLLRLAVFESVFFLVLGTPIIAFLLAQTTSLTLSIYAASLAILIGALAIFSPRWDNKEQTRSFKDEMLPMAVFGIALVFFHKLCLLWPDFFPMGERLRDFAILSSVIQSPINLQEPWMAGASLNYYAYWYRFGHMLSLSFSLKTYETYHLLQSFTFALYLGCAFRLMTAYFSIGKIPALIFSVCLCIGSNLAGIKDYLYEEGGWWGPSRVIPGAIHEFPAWSFILGDLHPHYLNLPLIPFFIVLFCSVYNSLKTAVSKAAAIFSCITCYYWISNSNAWEYPIWTLFVCAYLFFALVECAKRLAWPEKEPNKQDFFTKRDIIAVTLLFAFTISLYLSQKNIIAPSYAIDEVKDPIKRTLMTDMAQHFGLPLFVIITAILLTASDRVLKLAAITTVISLSVFKEALPILALLFLLNFVRVARTYKIFSKAGSSLKGNQLLIEVIGMISIALLIVPELVFLNDPYGGENERMNTIFKVYSANWFFIHIFAFYFLAQFFTYLAKKRSELRDITLRKTCVLGTTVLVILPSIFLDIAFFGSTALKERAIDQEKLTIKPYQQGLSDAEKNFPGSADTIKDLLRLPGGIVLEAQGKPYDYTSFVSTLSEHSAYLGWANHVNLLLNNNPEIARREKVTQTFYSETLCENKKTILKQESISYVIVGSLERKQYPNLKLEDFSCLQTVSSHGEYTVFKP